MLSGTRQVLAVPFGGLRVSLLSWSYGLDICRYVWGNIPRRAVVSVAEPLAHHQHDARGPPANENQEIND